MSLKEPPFGPRTFSSNHFKFSVMAFRSPLYLFRFSPLQPNTATPFHKKPHPINYNPRPPTETNKGRQHPC